VDTLYISFNLTVGIPNNSFIDVANVLFLGHKIA
jgi:hypothetical protein